jgi:hypothetical protein
MLTFATPNLIHTYGKFELLVYVYQKKSIFATASCRSKMEAVLVISSVVFTC